MSRTNIGHRTSHCRIGADFAGDFRNASGKPRYASPENGSLSCTIMPDVRVAVRPNITPMIARHTNLDNSHLSTVEPRHS